MAISPDTAPVNANNGRTRVREGAWKRFRPWSEAQDFPLPAADGEGKWLRVIDTSLPSGEDIADEGEEAPIVAPNYLLTARSCILLMIRK